MEIVIVIAIIIMYVMNLVIFGYLRKLEADIIEALQYFYEQEDNKVESALELYTKELEKNKEIERLISQNQNGSIDNLCNKIKSALKQ
jgi:hypothetical protein